MSFLQYVIAAVIAFSGVIAGAVLALLTKEEMPTAKKYFPLLQKVLIISTVVVFLNYFKIGLIIKIVVYALLIFTVLRAKTLNFYPVLAVLFFLLGQSSQSLFLISIMVFLYGFPTGSMYVINNKIRKWQALVKPIALTYGIFLIVAITLQFLYSVFVLKQF